MMMDVADWLCGLGLGQYETAFRENSVGMDVLPSLTADDLKDLGVNAVGDRRRLLNAIAALRSGAEAVVAQNTEESLAERRRLTVMFCDIAGSTALSTRLDPEDLSAVVRAYQSTVRSIISRCGGFIARYVGDGVLIYFGWPEAHETDAESAVRAALAVIAAVNERPLHGEHLTVRIGIATGLVVVGSPIGEGDARQQTAIGETPNLAARLQSLADPNGIVIDAATHRQIGGFFKFRDLGTIALKGLPNQVPAWEVLEEAGVESRFEALRADTMTPLVGRQEELDLLQRRWVRARSGEGQVVLVSGEPGIGKSRLLAALEERLASEPHVSLRYFCSPHHQDSPLYPVIARLEREAGFVRDDTAASRLAKLEAVLAPTMPPLEDIALFAALLSIPTNEHYPVLEQIPQRLRTQTVVALLRRLSNLARKEPVLLLFEDAHWSDPSSIELLDAAIEQVPNLPILLIISFRPEFLAPWLGRSRVSFMALNRLDRLDATALAGQVVKSHVLPSPLLDLIVTQSEGVPLFIEELTKAMLEAPDLGAAGASLAVPDTLQGSLMARLDRMPAARMVAQIGSVIGHEFSYALLAAVAGLQDAQLAQGLNELVTAGLLFRRGAPPDAEYTFKHALVQDTAYGSLLRSLRQQLHGRIATAIENQFSELATRQPEVLALHYQQAWNVEQSFKYWALAGDICEQRGASSESVNHYRSACKQLGMPDPPNTIRRREPEIYIKLGNALMQADGFNSEEGREAFGRARSAAAELELPEEYAKASIGIAPLLFGQCRYHEVIQIGEGISTRLLQHVRSQTRIHLWTMLGSASYSIGEFKAALEYETCAAKLDDEVQCTHRDPIAGGDPAVVCRSYAQWSSAALGLLKESTTWSEQAWDIAKARGHAFSVAWAGVIRMRSLNLVGRYLESLDIGSVCVGICERHGFNARLGSVLERRGEARFAIGEREEGLADVRHGMALWQQASGSFSLTHFICTIVSCLLRLERTGEAEQALQEAEEILGKTEEQYLCSEIERLRGQLLEAEGEREQAIICYQNALEWSRVRHAKLFELRASMSLARLWRDQGLHAAACNLLAPVYDWFNDGLDVPDLQHAKSLLDTVRH